MRALYAIFALLAAVVSTPSRAAFGFFDDPAHWGCAGLFLAYTAHTLQTGPELVIPQAAVAEAAKVPWATQLGSQLRIRMLSDGQPEQPIAITVGDLSTFTVEKVDPDRTLNAELAELLGMAKRTHRHYVQLVAFSGKNTAQRRPIWSDPVGIDDLVGATNALDRQLQSYLGHSGELQKGEWVNFYLLAADAQDGLPPTLYEVGLAKAIFRLALRHINRDPARYPGRGLITMLKASHSVSVQNLLFIYDPWDDSSSHPVARPRPK